MSAQVLVTYATSYRSTQEVAENVAGTLRESGFQVELEAMRKARSLTGYDAIVMGAPLYMFHWHKDARRFLS
jgi:menaquinone-dependent protoporphyrinogen oxidase